MFDKYIIDPASVQNVGPADAPTGFSFVSKLGYYRGLGLSMVEDLEVAIDGEGRPRAPWTEMYSTSTTATSSDQRCNDDGPNRGEPGRHDSLP